MINLNKKVKSKKEFTLYFLIGFIPSTGLFIVAFKIFT